MAISIRPLWQEIVDRILLAGEIPSIPERAPHPGRSPDFWGMSGTGSCMLIRTLMRDGIDWDSPLYPFPPNARARRAMAWGTMTHHVVETMIEKYAREWDMGEVAFIEKKVVHPQWNAVGHFDFEYRLDGREVEYDLKTANPQIFRHLQKQISKSENPEEAHIYWWQSAGYGIARRVQMIPAPSEGYRIWIIAKGDFREDEATLYRSPKWVEALDTEYAALNEAWEAGTLPPCTCNTSRNQWLVDKKLCGYYGIGDPCCLQGLEIQTREDAREYLQKRSNGLKALNGEDVSNGAY